MLVFGQPGSQARAPQLGHRARRARLSVRLSPKAGAAGCGHVGRRRGICSAVVSRLGFLTSSRSQVAGSGPTDLANLIPANQYFQKLIQLFRPNPEAFEIHLQLCQAALKFHRTASFRYRYFREWEL